MKWQQLQLSVSVGLGIAAAASGCQQDSAEQPRLRNGMPGLDVNYTVSNGIQPNGIQPNGIQPNGIQPNGTSQGASSPNGILLSSIIPPALGVTGIHLDGTVLVGTLPDQSTVSGPDFVGSAMIENLANGSSISLHIDAISDSVDPEIKLYNVSYLADVEGQATWVSRCGYDGNGVALKAFPLGGYWNYEEGTPRGGSHTEDSARFTFACEGFALAKCAEFGYKPWKTTEECNSAEQCQQLSIAPFHQACTRMLRADYCGDGYSHTVDGTLVNVWDNGHVLAPDLTSWALEAEWTPGGPACIRHVRWTAAGLAGAQASLDYIAAHCPAKFVGPNDPTCGSAASTFTTESGFATPLSERVLLRNESESPPQGGGGGSGGSGGSSSSSSGGGE